MFKATSLFSANIMVLNCISKCPIKFFIADINEAIKSDYVCGYILCNTYRKLKIFGRRIYCCS